MADVRLTSISAVALVLEQEALFGSTFAPTFVKEGETLTLRCSFTEPLLPFQQDVTWFRDGEAWPVCVCMCVCVCVCLCRVCVYVCLAGWGGGGAFVKTITALPT